MNKSMKIINTVAFLAMIIVNLLANIVPFGGKTTGEVSAAYPNLFTPAPITFAIWGVIYVLLAGFILYQWGIFDKGILSSGLVRHIGIWFTVTCVLNIAWILLWHSDAIGFSTLCIAGLLISLVILQKKTSIYSDGIRGYALFRAGFDIYFGWIIVASIANVSVFLTKYNWNGFGLSDSFWMSVILIAGAIIGIATVVVSRKYLSGAAVIWAYTGILIRHFSSDGFNGRYPFVIAMTLLGIIAIICSIAITADRSKVHILGFTGENPG